MANKCKAYLEKESPGENNIKQIPESFYQDLDKKFRLFTPLEEQEEAIVGGNVSDRPSIIKQSFVSITNAGARQMESYFANISSFKAVKTYDIFINAENNKNSVVQDKNKIFRNIMTDIIDRVMPPNPIKPLPDHIANFLPLRISIIGDKFVGKKTIASKLASELEIPVIDPDKLILKAKSFVKEEDPEENEEEAAKDKKKKKPAPKKAELAEPVELTEVELQYQAIGIKIKEFEACDEEIPDSYRIDLVVLEIKNLFPEWKYEEMKAKYFEKLEIKKKTDLEKKNEPAKNDKKAPVEAKKANGRKPKAAPSKKGAAEKEPSKDDIEEEDEKDTNLAEKHAFIYGYILIGMPTTREQARMLDSKLTNYESLENRINPSSDDMKEKIRRVLDIPDAEPEKNSFPSLDIVCILDLQKEQIHNRVKALKRDPTTGYIYDPIVNPAPEADKKLIGRLENVDYNQDELDHEID